jgi:hypothetical protein
MSERPEGEQQDHDDVVWSGGEWSDFADDDGAAERAAFNEYAEHVRIESGVLWRAELEALGPGEVMTREELEIEPVDLWIEPVDLTLENPFEDDPDPWR